MADSANGLWAGIGTRLAPRAESQSVQGSCGDEMSACGVQESGGEACVLVVGPMSPLRPGEDTQLSEWTEKILSAALTNLQDS